MRSGSRLDPPFVSVIVPARDAGSSVRECLSALCDQSYPRDRYEVLLVDDGSIDDTADVAEPLADQVLRIAPSGPGAARNRGVEASSGDLLLFTDADCVPFRDWIATLVAAFDDPAVVGAKGTYVSEQREWTARFVQAEYESRYEFMARRQRIDFIDTYSAAYRREVFEATGGFDESFRMPSVEDQELGFRVAATGGALVFVAGARVAHRHAASPIAYFRKKTKIAYWKMKVLARYPRKAFRDSHTPRALKVEIIAAAGFWTSLAASVCAPVCLAGAAVSVVVHAVASAPFVARVLPKNRALAWRAPLFLGLRSTALLIGMLRGMAGEPLRERASERRMAESTERQWTA